VNRNFILILFIISSLISSTWAQGNPQTRVRHAFQNTDLVEALRVLAQDMGVELIVNPDVQGTVSIDLMNIPAQEAIRRILDGQKNQYCFTIIEARPHGSTLIVAPPSALGCMDHNHGPKTRMEFLLEAAPAAKVMTFLEAEYANVEFSKHPTMNGFYAQGSREDLLQIKRELSNLDRAPEPPPPPLRAYTGRIGVGYNGGGSAIEAESYFGLEETGYREVTRRPLSTFSIDVDTASYANVRRFLNDGRLPPPDAVRIEEMLNYFRYDYPQPQGDVPFSLDTELTECPWNPEHQLLRIGLQGRRTESEKTPPRNLVFLLDVSGSMEAEDKLPLVKRAMKLLLEEMGEQDRVAIVVYAGTEGLALPSTPCDQRSQIREKIETLRAEGSTNGSAGIQLAYDLARQIFRKGAINRVILCTDGDFNVGLTGGSLTSLIEKEREGGIFLTVLGFGTGNIKDDTMEELADHGNGNYAYIDSLFEAQKVLVRESGSTLETIAKDVKLQIEFNPKRVHTYRLVGYENRRLEDEEFADDKKDAGELGAGHSVTALYELIPDGNSETSPLRYQRMATPTKRADSDELALLKLRYKAPTGEVSKSVEFPITERLTPFARASEGTRFAASVAAFGMVLRDSDFKGDADLVKVGQWAPAAVGKDPHGDRSQFVKLVNTANALMESPAR